MVSLYRAQRYLVTTKSQFPARFSRVILSNQPVHTHIKLIRTALISFFSLNAKSSERRWCNIRTLWCFWRSSRTRVWLESSASAAPRPMTVPDRRRARNKEIIHATSFGASCGHARGKGSRRSSIFFFRPRPLAVVKKGSSESPLHLP